MSYPAACIVTLLPPTARHTVRPSAPHCHTQPRVCAGGNDPRSGNSSITTPGFLRRPQRWSVGFLLAPKPGRRALLFLLALGGAAVELAAAPAALFGGRLSLLAVFAGGTSLHLGAMPLLGIIAPFSIPCYALALLPPAAAACPTTKPAVLAALALASATLLELQDWPLNAMGLYSYNAAQMRRLTSLMGRFVLTESRGIGGAVPMRSPCLTEICVQGTPNRYYHQFHSIVFAQLSDEATAEQLSAWVRRYRRFVCAETGRCFDGVALVEPSAQGRPSLDS